MLPKDKHFDHTELDFFKERYDGMDKALFERFLRVIFGSYRLLGILDHYLGLYDLSQGRFHLLMELFKHNETGGITLGELARIVGVSNASVTGLVDTLEKTGMVKRTRSKSDRRKISVTLTEEAIDFFDRFLPFHQENIRTFTAALSEAEMETLASLMDRMYQQAAPHIKSIEELDAKGRQELMNSCTSNNEVKL